MGVNIPKINYPESNPALFLGTMYYNYKYDQLNRITGMDAYTKYLAAAQAWPSYIVSLDDYRERVSYDANGNILKYLRNGTTLNSKPLSMDSLTYKYYTGTNQLRQVRDNVNAANYTEDIDDQSDTSNYVYDAIGNMIRDKAEGIDSIKWNVYGKILSIHKSSGLNIWYTYDAGGNRVSKKVKNGSDSSYTWYARDASGNVLSVYRIKNDTTYQDELHLYGSSRIGMIRPDRNLILAKQYGDTTGMLTLVGAWKGNVYRRGQKFFELANHLGNVLVTISDKKLGIDGNTDGTVDYYMPDVMTANDYYPFGMGMPERKFSLSNVYRYGFNGKENDNEVKGEGGQQDYGMRIYDPRLGKFLSVDPITAQYPELTPYQFASNTPIEAIDLDGLEQASSKGLASMAMRGAAGLKQPGKMQLNGIAAEHRTSCHAQWKDIQREVARRNYEIYMSLDREHFQIETPRWSAWKYLWGDRQVEVDPDMYNRILAEPKFSQMDPRFKKLLDSKMCSIIPNTVTVNDDGYVTGIAVRSNLLGGSGSLGWIGRLGAIKTLATIPKGFSSAEQFAQVGNELKAALQEAGIEYTYIGVRGSAVTNVSSKGGAFREIATEGKKASDIDVFVQFAANSSKANASGFIHYSKLLKQFPSLQQWSKKWSGILGREITPAGWNPGKLTDKNIINF